ncbi:MAG: sulfatase [Reichenbachiella sp.]|uniref:sulfatase family protein n=1 Tax=Reichenbachiella sp. TaxID=2184521 RepID=UPI003267F6DC
MRNLSIILLLATMGCQIEKTEQPYVSGKNVIFILSDDHRYDFMGFMGKVPFLQTPNMDRMAADGAHLQNAFVSTSLCSPSRASILTGQYAHHHRVIDNQSMVPDSVTFFPQYLQKAGYQTGYVGKWHMGEHHDNPRKGFDYWASFKGQGAYYNPSMNVNGTREEYSDSSYITDVLTKYAFDFLENREENKPFFLYLSHKSVHSEFLPAPRHRNQYAKESPAYPKTMYPPGHEKSTLGEEVYNYEDLPDWVKAQRDSWHGVDQMYHGAIDFDDFYKNYCETLLALDESIGQVLDYLEKEGLMENTIVFYMGDNGFSFGEHGLIDKRQAYEESMRVPLLILAKGEIEEGMKVDEVVQNIDIAPSILEMAGLPTPDNMDGSSFNQLLLDEQVNWKDTIFYEYYWERPFPQTPTVHAVRTSKFKYIRYHGIWDINELYDIEKDPLEMNNLIRDPSYKEISIDLRKSLFNWLKETDGMDMPIVPDRGRRFDHRYINTY